MVTMKQARKAHRAYRKAGDGLALLSLRQYVRKHFTHTTVCTGKLAEIFKSGK